MQGMEGKVTSISPRSHVGEEKILVWSETMIYGLPAVAVSIVVVSIVGEAKEKESL